jgi:UDP-N-acetylmuramate--alanine ligase
MSSDLRHIHIIGVGGIGTSALAQYYLAMGYVVSGSDANESDITNFLKDQGIKVYIGHKPENIRGASLIIHSAAVKEGNPEYDTAKLDRIPTKLYAEAMGEITDEYTLIAISGSHGKSTTTAMVAKIMIDAGLDPTVIVGTKMHELGGNNFHKGSSEFFVLEADDYNRHFHHYHPTVSVVTNVDREHLDIYKNIEGVKEAFLKFVQNTKTGGTIIVNGQDKDAVDVVRKADLLKNQVILYNENDLARHDLGVVGEHNQSNAEAAYWVGEVLGINKESIKKSLSGFRGTWRRMEEIKEGVYTDYAHHPTEIKATLSALKGANPSKKLICVFQPHQRDRLTQLFSDFAESFSSADELVLVPLYAVRGRDDGGGKSSKELAELIKKPQAIYKPSFDKAYDEAMDGFDSEKIIVVFMGAGDIDEQLRAKI